MINLETRLYYKVYGHGESEDTIRSRLIQLNELGMEEIGYAQFGIKGVMSGLYIEMVWNYSEKEWDEYIDWVKSLI